MSDENISNDTVVGMQAIEAFTGFSRRRAYYLATTGQLPGAFRMGKSWALLKSVYAAELRSRAAKSAEQSPAAA